MPDLTTLIFVLLLIVACSLPPEAQSGEKNGPARRQHLSHAQGTGRFDASVPSGRPPRAPGTAAKWQSR